MTVDAAAWVVEIGIARAVAPKIAVVAPMLTATAVLTLSLVNFNPMVWMIFQPSRTVPNAIAV
jgi:hypothetical protein